MNNTAIQTRAKSTYSAAIRTQRIGAHARIKKYQAALWLVPLAVFFYLFQLAPMGWVLLNSFMVEQSWSLDHYREIFNSSLR